MPVLTFNKPHVLFIARYLMLVFIARYWNAGAPGGKHTAQLKIEGG